MIGHMIQISHMLPIIMPLARLTTGHMSLMRTTLACAVLAPRTCAVTHIQSVSIGHHRRQRCIIKLSLLNRSTYFVHLPAHLNFIFAEEFRCL